MSGYTAGLRHAHVPTPLTHRTLTILTSAPLPRLTPAVRRICRPGWSLVPAIEAIAHVPEGRGCERNHNIRATMCLPPRRPEPAA
eukprot:6931842-Prymnesium_polylepis.2